MKLIVVVILFCINLIGFSQTVIEGNAPNYKGKTVSLLTFDDYITYTYKTLGKTKVDSNGKFTFSVNDTSAFKAIIEIEDKSGFLYIDPNTAEYKIHFPAYTQDGKPINGNIVQIIFEDLPKNDLNTLILEFNLRLDNFLYGDTTKMMRLVMQNDAFKDSLDQFKAELLTHYKELKNDYFFNYMRYSIASVEQFSTGNDIVINRYIVFDNYIKDKPVLYRNDAYMSFINQFYENILKAPVKGGDEDLFLAINNHASKEELEKVFAKDAFLHNEQIREIAMIKGLAEEYHSDNFIKENLLKLIEAIGNATKYPENKKIATNTINLITKLQPGYPATDFAIPDKKGDTISLSLFKGKHIYLTFFATWNSISLQEMEIMKDLEKKYGKYIEFISICVNKDEKAFNEFLKNYPDYKWHILYYQGDVGLLSEYRITSLPMYYLVDPKGNILQAPAYKPSPNNNYESIDRTFFNIKKKLEPKHKTKIGEKD